MAGDSNQQSTVVTRTLYQMFIGLVMLLALAITLLYYLVPLPETVRQVLYILDSLLSPFLLYDFCARLYYAHNRLKYFVTLRLVGPVRVAAGAGGAAPAAHPRSDQAGAPFAGRYPR